LQAIDFPSFTTTAGALSFDWGDDTGKLIEAFFTFLYLDFIGSSITFVSMGSMCGILDADGNIPYSNRAFISGMALQNLVPLPLVSVAPFQ
jgi:adenine/guanine/hypoxanthine permease